MEQGPERARWLIAASSASLARFGSGRQVHDLGQVRVGISLGYGQSGHEMLLESWLDRSLHLLDHPGYLLDLGAGDGGEKAIIAPTPAAFLAAETRSMSQSGIIPSTIVYRGSI